MDSLKHDILLQTNSTVLRQAVEDSLSTLGVSTHRGDGRSIRLKIVHVAKGEQLGSLQESRDDDRPVILLVEKGASPTDSSQFANAVSILELPFLSNELRVHVGRVLRLRVSDADVYEKADRPVPTVVREKSIIETDLDVTSPPRPASLPTKQTLRTDELPPIDTFADMPKVSISQSLPPLPQAAVQTAEPNRMLDQSSIDTISAEYIEKVVWEVVPKLAERILREEIARLLEDR